MMIGAEPLSRDPRMMQWASAAFLGIVLLLVFLVGAAAIIHFSRRYRQYLLRKKSAPTQADDVWSMHQIPNDADQSSAEP